MDITFLPSMKKAISENKKFYFTALVILVGIKFFYATADSDRLLWILAPTAWWIEILSGITFEYVSPIGFINHSLQFIFAPSCSGVRFMVICSAMLIFSFLHRRKSDWGRFWWLAGSLAFSYLLTILINGFRVVVSIRLPLFLLKSGISQTLNPWLSPEKLHTMMGTIIYFTSLLAIYSLADACLERADSPSPKLARWWLPAFWYFAILLGIPLMSRPWKAGSPAFLSYAGLTVLPCMFLLGVVEMIGRICGRLKR